MNTAYPWSREEPTEAAVGEGGGLMNLGAVLPWQMWLSPKEGGHTPRGHTGFRVEPTEAGWSSIENVKWGLRPLAGCVYFLALTVLVFLDPDSLPPSRRGGVTNLTGDGGERMETQGVGSFLFLGSVCWVRPCSAPILQGRLHRVGVGAGQWVGHSAPWKTE